MDLGPVLCFMDSDIIPKPDAWAAGAFLGDLWLFTSRTGEVKIQNNISFYCVQYTFSKNN